MELALLGIRRESDLQKDRSSNMGTRCNGTNIHGCVLLPILLRNCEKKKAKKKYKEKHIFFKKRGTNGESVIDNKWF